MTPMPRARRLPTLAAIALAGSLGSTGSLAQEGPSSLAQDPSCQALMQAGVQGAQGRVQADDEAIQPPRSVKTLTCLRGFFSGQGFDTLISLPNIMEMADGFANQICEAAANMWRGASGSAQCGLTVRGINLGGFGFGGLGGGAYCPTMAIGGDGPVLGSAGGSFQTRSGTTGGTVTINGQTTTIRPATAGTPPIVAPGAGGGTAQAPASGGALQSLRDLFR